MYYIPVVGDFNGGGGSSEGDIVVSCIVVALGIVMKSNYVVLAKNASVLLLPLSILYQLS